MLAVPTVGALLIVNTFLSAGFAFNTSDQHTAVEKHRIAELDRHIAMVEAEMALADTDPVPDLALLYDAIRIVETGGEPNEGRDAVGDNGQSIGPYQIQRAYWKDALEFNPSVGGKYEDVRNKDYAERIMLLYWKRYATERRLGRSPTFEDLARIHNGGPNGHRRGATIPYWEKVQKQLNQQTKE